MGLPQQYTVEQFQTSQLEVKGFLPLTRVTIKDSTVFRIQYTKI